MRSLADDLRRREDARLARLFALRPDLARPLPSGITALAARATTAPSLARFLDGLDALHLHVLAHVRDHEPVGSRPVVDAVTSALAPGARGAVEQALADLVDAATIWGDDAALRTVHSVHDVLTTTPAPTWPPPRAGSTTRLDAAAVDARAALAACAVIGLVRDLVDDWSAEPPAILRSGGLGVRDLATARRRLHTDTAGASLVIEVAHAAHLVADDGEEVPRWVPTDRFDDWIARHTWQQWIDLLDAWLTLPRLPSFVDDRTQVLAAERDRRAIPVLRREVLDVLLALPPGAATDADRIVAVLDDGQPRRAGELRRLTVTATLQEGEELGVLSAGALSTAARAWLASDRGPSDTRVANALNAALPPEASAVIVQADLTIVAPGPLVSHVARTLRLLADIESRGHATVYRVTRASIRRGLDSGHDAASIRRALEEVSATELPQPLVYLVEEVAAGYGSVRVGPALAYVRTATADAAAAILADRRLRPLGLTRLADTVLAAQATPSELVAALREAGLAPAAESPTGEVVARAPVKRRIHASAPRRRTATRTRASTEAAVRAVRAGDRPPPGHQPVSEGPPLTAGAALARLRSAARDAQPVWIGYADTDGTVTSQVVDPIRLAAGILTAYDHRTEQVRSFAVSRVTGVGEVVD